jgi:cob(I)alamin adenosyltransferase
MTHIYTRTGDGGNTGLLGGGRVRKSHERVVACGEVDELNALVGMAYAESSDDEIKEMLQEVQRDLLALGARLAALDADSLATSQKSNVGADEIAMLESWIDRVEGGLPELHRFLLPGGARVGAVLHLARTVCRRAERSVVALADREDVQPELIAYLNRLSDLMFSLARKANAEAGTPEQEW